jgi:hypothetical protein
MIPAPLLVAFALVGAIAALLLLDRMIRDIGFTAGVLLVVSGVVVIVGEPPGVNVGGFQLTINDVLMGFVGSAFAARMLRRVRFPVAARFLTGILVLVVWSLIRGIGDYGVATAMNEARGSLAVYLVALYFATAPPTDRIRERLGRAWLAYAMFLVVLAVERWLAVLGPLPTNDAWYIPGEYGGLRVLWSDEAFVLGQTFVLLLPGLMHGTLSRGRRLTAVAALGTVMLTQHRSVWAATLVGIATVLLLEGNIGRKWARRLILATGVTSVLLLTLFSGPLLERSVSSSDAASSDTFEWRMEGWTALYRDSGPQSAAEVVVGRPYGAGWERRLTSLGYSTDVVPHNYYVEQDLRVGLVGLALMLALYVVVMRRLARSAATGPQVGLLSDRVLPVLLAMQLLYFIPYWPAPEQALLMGFAVAAARGGARGGDGAAPGRTASTRTGGTLLHA